LILSGPFFGVAFEPPRLKAMVGRLSSRIYPKLDVPSGLSGKDMTHDVEKARAYDEDPLSFHTVNVRWFTECEAAQERAISAASRLSLPLYLAFGTADRVVNINKARRFFEAAGSTDKTWDSCEGLYHEVLNEPSWKDLVERIARWIIAHA
jgi:alpha-beta hydrolase superfamily lysophospholipase